MKYDPEQFFDARNPILKSKVRLPHWEQERVLQFVTWNLGDALPVKAIRRWKFQKDRWVMSHPKPWDDQTEKEYIEKFVLRWERWLDCGRGSCLLKNGKAASVVAESLQYFDASRYNLDCFVVMPNHVHVLFAPMEGCSLRQIIHSWKSFTAHSVSDQGMWKGKLWMKDYWDRMIRDMDHYRRVRNYIKMNPVKAELREGEYLLWMGGE